MAATKGGLFGKRSSGTAGAEFILHTLRHLDTDITGIGLHGRTYPNGKATTGDVIDYLAEPNRGPSRDIRPNDDDGHAAAELFVAEVVRRINRGKKKKFKSKAAKLRARKAAKAAAAGGFRKAGKWVRTQLIERAAEQTLNNGNPADKVSKPYARQRKNKYNVAEHAVFKASGLLFGDLTGGQLKLHRRGGII
jgi:hypothetical protein